jgi:hypothetical protein
MIVSGLAVGGRGWGAAGARAAPVAAPIMPADSGVNGIARTAKSAWPQGHIRLSLSGGKGG